MKALVYSGDYSVCFREVQAPEDAAGEITVDVLQAGICGTDIGAVKHGRPAIAPFMTLGHEFVARRRDTGEMVIGNPLIGCGQCRTCLRGSTHLCANRAVLGVHRPGAFAPSVRLPLSRIVSMQGATLEQAALVDPLATALHAFRLAPRPEGPVAVLGAGAIGLSLLVVLKSEGIEDITVTDLAAERLEYARALGVSRVASRAEGSYDVVYDTVGAPSTRQDAVLRSVAGGHAVLVGLHSPELQVAAGPLIAGERTIHGSFGYTDSEFLEAAKLASQVRTDWVHTIPFDAAESEFQAILAGRSHPAHVKVQMRIGF